MFNFLNRYLAVRLVPYSEEYLKVHSGLTGNYYQSFEGIYRVQNPLLWAKYRHRLDDYHRRGSLDILTLYHDTSVKNVNSICERNFDWRFGKQLSTSHIERNRELYKKNIFTGQRFKFGPGVYFSIHPEKACKHSSKLNGPVRAMFVVDVLVHNVLVSKEEDRICLPSHGYDTVLAHNDETYVKYFDCEYYPKYFMVYHTKTNYHTGSLPLYSVYNN